MVRPVFQESGKESLIVGQPSQKCVKCVCVNYTAFAEAYYM